MPMSPRLLRPRASGFNPRSVAPMSLWLDATDTTSTTLDAGVTTWADKSGNGRNFTQTIGANQPSIGSLNGKRAVSFDGLNDQLTRTAVNNSDFVSANGGAVFVVFSANNDSSYNVFYNGGQNSQRDIFDGDSSNYSSTLRAARFETVAIGFMPTNSSAIYAHTVNSTTHAIRINTTQRATASSDLANYRAKTNQTWRLGNGPEAATFLNGAIGEVLFYSEPLSANQVSAVEQYLRNKWGTP